MEAILLKEFRDLRALFEKEVVTKVRENQARVAKFEEERKKDSSQDETVWHSMFDDDTDEESIEEDNACVYEQDWANLGVEATLKENEARECQPGGFFFLWNIRNFQPNVEDTLAVFGKMPKDVRKGEVNVQRFVSLVCKQCKEDSLQEILARVNFASIPDQAAPDLIEESLRQSKAAKPAHDAQEVRIEAASSHRPVGHSTGIAFGTVAKVLKKKGYAWIRRDDGQKDLFAHFREFDGNEEWAK
eukprot:symbB.v1.2.040647.t1/scaffold7407.1/size14627/1